MLRLSTGCQRFFDRPSSSLKGGGSAESGESSAIKFLLNKIGPAVAPADDREKPLLILGGPGAGKRRLAKKLFQSRLASTQSFLDINLAPRFNGEWEGAEEEEEETADKRLFNGGGPKEFVEQFEGGFVFIKEIDGLPATLQFKLLKVLKSADYREKEAEGRIRLTASAGADLPEKAERGLFCEELFHQFSLCRIPDLKDRSKEVPRLTRFFLKRNHFNGDVAPEALSALSRCEWRGNVGELKKLCVRLSAVCSDKHTIGVSDLPAKIRNGRGAPNGENSSEFLIKYSPDINLKNLKNRYIKLAVRHFKCKKKAAEALGISVKTIYNKGIV